MAGKSACPHEPRSRWSEIRADDPGLSLAHPGYSTPTFLFTNARV